MNKERVMTWEHPQWEDFCERLEGAEGCNFRNVPRENGTMRSVWNCGGGHDKTFATAILKTIEGVDVAASLVYFEEHGGYCDCEILFNVDAD